MIVKNCRFASRNMLLVEFLHQLMDEPSLICYALPHTEREVLDNRLLVDHDKGNFIIISAVSSTNIEISACNENK